MNDRIRPVSGRRVALVTGASRGIGRAVAERLEKEGFTVIANVHSATAEVSQLTRLYKRQKRDIHIMVADVSSEDLVEQMLTIIQARFHRLDVVVNNAGVIHNEIDETLENISESRLSEYFAVNVHGGVYVTRHALPLLKKSKNARVLFINSALSFIGTGRRFGYTISKTTNIGVVRALALELAPHNINVNAVVPGYIQTKMANFPGRGLAEKISRIPLKRLGETSDVAHLVAFLVTPESSYITGQHIHVNGGLYLA